jgi:hypothetical protein
MKFEIPNSYDWFAKLNLTQFIPWRFEKGIKNIKSSYNEQFEVEYILNRKVLTFGSRQNTSTSAGFEIIDEKVTEHVIVFHQSFGGSEKNWITIKSEHTDFFEFMQKRVLPDMKEWIPMDDVNEYLEK